MPYFGYARQDNINSQNIIPSKLIADFLEKLGVNYVITIDSPFGGTNLHLPDGEALACHVHHDALAS